MKTLSLVVPVWNAPSLAVHLAEHIPSLKRVAAEKGFSLVEAIFVEDGSTNVSTLETLALAAGDVPVLILQNASNRGKGYSVRRGFMAASGEWVLMSDVDESAPLTEFARLSAHCDAALVCGARRRDDGRPLHRRLLSYVFHFLSGIHVVHDTQCGFKLFNRAKMFDVFALLQTERFAFDVELVMRAPSVAEVFIDWHGGRRSSLKVFRDAPRMLLDLFLLRNNHS